MVRLSLGLNTIAIFSFKLRWHYLFRYDLLLYSKLHSFFDLARKGQQINNYFTKIQPKKPEAEGSNFGFGGDKVQSGYVNNNSRTNWITQPSDEKIPIIDQKNINLSMNKYIDKLVDNGSWILLQNNYGVHMTFIFKDKSTNVWFKVVATTDLPREAINEPLIYRSFRLPKSQKNFLSTDEQKSDFLESIGVKNQSKDEIRISKNLFNETNAPEHFKVEKRNISIDTYKKINEKQFEGKEEDPNKAVFDQFFVISKITETDISSIKEKMQVNKFIEYKHLPIELYERSGFNPTPDQFELYQRFFRKLIFDVVSREDYQEYVKTKHFINKNELEEEDVMGDFV